MFKKLECCRAIPTNDVSSVPFLLLATGYSGAGRFYTTVRRNQCDPPVLEVLLLQALVTTPTVTTFLGSRLAISTVQHVSNKRDISVLLGDRARNADVEYNEENQTSSREHTSRPPRSSG